MGYHLARRGVPFVILDAGERIGDQWRKRWDSLRLFTPARFSSLDGLPFPADAGFVSDQGRDGRLPRSVRPQICPAGALRCSRGTCRGWANDFSSSLVINASRRTTWSSRWPTISDRACRRLRTSSDPRIVQLHSFEYRNPAQFQEGAVLVVGAGNSGAEIALDAARAHDTCVAGRDTGHVPFRIDGLAARLLLVRLVLRVVFHRILTVATPMGRKVRAKVLHEGGVLVRTKPRDLTAAGITRAPRVAGVRNGLPLLEDGRVLDVANVVWCTGFHPGFSWIDLPVFGLDGEPQHDRGVVSSEPGLYFVGLHFLFAMSSVMIHGVGRDAERIADRISATRREADHARRPDPGAAVHVA